MKRFITLLFTTLLVLSVNAQTQPQEIRTSSAPGFVNVRDSVSVYKALYENTPIEPAFMLVPKFAIIGAESKFIFSTGANMKFTASYDIGNPVRNPGGIGPADITPARLGVRGLFQMTAGGSGIYFNIIGFPNTANQIGLFISLGIDSDSNNSYKLNAGQVYMRYRDFQCGYATSLYNDRRADAYLIDGHGACASGAHSAVGMNWQTDISRHVRFGIGVELPNASYTQIVPDDSDLEAVLLYQLTSHQTIPDIPAYIEYDWGSGHVRLANKLRTINYVDFITANRHHIVGTSIKITGNQKVGPVNLLGMGQYGWGGSSYFRDDSDKGLDLVPDDATPGKLRKTRSAGYIIAAQWDISPKVFSTFQYSYLRNYVHRYTINAITPYNDLLRRGHTVSANIIWKLSSLFNTGFEYRYVRRTNQDRSSLGTSRFYAMLLMTF